MAYWLMKSEPQTFSIDDLQACPQGTEHWDGIRNYQARNYMRDQMRPGDEVLFYHSNSKPSGIVGQARIVSPAYTDHTAFDSQAHYYDPNSDPNQPKWVMVDVQFVCKWVQMVPLAAIKANPLLQGMLLITHSRLSISPVTAQHWQQILQMRALAESAATQPV